MPPSRLNCRQETGDTASWGWKRPSPSLSVQGASGGFRTEEAREVEGGRERRVMPRAGVSPGLVPG